MFRRIGTTVKEKLVDLLPHRWQCKQCKCPKFEVIANLEVESVVNTFAVIIHLKLSHYGNDRLRKRV